jgi:transcriptional regulator with XRE-family HTH domain
MHQYTWGEHMQTNLKELRQRQGITQLQLQMGTGIEQALLSKFENGTRVPPTETLLVLAEFYHVSIDYILCRTDDPKLHQLVPNNQK